MVDTRLMLIVESRHIFVKSSSCNSEKESKCKVTFFRITCPIPAIKHFLLTPHWTVSNKIIFQFVFRESRTNSEKNGWTFWRTNKNNKFPWTEIKHFWTDREWQTYYAISFFRIMKNYFFSKTIPKCTILNKFEIVKELRTNWKNFPLFEFLKKA